MKIQAVQFAAREIMYSGHLQSLGAASISYTGARVLGIDFHIGIILVPYLLFQAIYFFDRYRDLNIDRLTNVKRTQHIGSYAPLIPFIIAALLGAVVIILLKYAHIGTLLFAIIIAGLGFLYPIWFKNITKQVPLFKDIYVSSVFAVIAIFPILFFGQPIYLTPALLIFLLFIFSEAMIMQVILDLKDFSSDTKQGLQTLPALLGTNKAYKKIIISSLAVPAVVFIATTVGILLYLALTASIINLYSAWLVSRRDARGYTLEAAKFIAWPVLLILI